MGAAPVDQEKLNQFYGRFVGELGAIAHAPTILIGEKLGLYKALAKASGGLTSEELARKTKTHPRMVHEWLCSQAASGFVEVDATGERFSMTSEQAFALTDKSSAVDIAGALTSFGSGFKDWTKVAKGFRDMKGLGWDRHSKELFIGTGRFFKASYQASLVPSWLPALEGALGKLERGAKVADVGCGHGASTIIMAKAFPNSRFFGYDFHARSIESAKRDAKKAGVADRVEFAVASATDFPGQGYDLIACFDCLHDMGDPEGAARHIHSALAADGTWMIVEPAANEQLGSNLNPVGRVYYSASTQICVPASIAQGGKVTLGAQAGDSLFEAIAKEAGFHRFRRATETPFNRIFEARP